MPLKAPEKVDYSLAGKATARRAKHMKDPNETLKMTDKPGAPRAPFFPSSELMCDIVKAIIHYGNHDTPE